MKTAKQTKQDRTEAWGRVTLDQAISVIRFATERYCHPADAPTVNGMLRGMLLGLASTLAKNAKG